MKENRGIAANDMKSAALGVKLNEHDSLLDASSSWSPLLVQVTVTLLLNTKMNSCLPACTVNALIDI